MTVSKQKLTHEERSARGRQKSKQKQQRKALRKAGICVQCSTKPHVNGFYCQDCLNYRVKLHEAKRKQESEELRKYTERNQPYLDSADIVWTAAKWLARATGAGYDDSDQALTDAVFAPFWDALPNGSSYLIEIAHSNFELLKIIVSQAQADVAYEAGLLAFKEYTKIAPEMPRCPECNDNNLNNRSGNDYKCSKCGWECLPGTFGAIYIGMQH